MSAVPFLALLALVSGCYRDVPEYCDAGRACPADRPVCLLPEHECAAPVAWGELSGTQAVPANPSAFGGSVQIARNGAGALVYRLEHDAAGVREVHLHRGRPGEPAGAPLLSLDPASGSIGVLATLSDDQVMGVLAGDYYLDLHTDAFPEGEVRAQILPLGGRGGQRSFHAVLTGLQALQPVASRYTGRATLVLDERSGEISYDIDLGGMPLSTVFGIHVHRGAFHGEGPHVVDVPLTAPRTGRLLPSMVFPQQRQLYPVLLQAGLAYLNIHTEQFAGGELRGQILPGASGPLPFRVVLRGQQVVPAVTTSASGVAHLLLSEDGTRLAYRVEQSAARVKGIGVGRAKAGLNGPELARLPRERGVLDLSAQARTELLSEGLYLTVLTEQHPLGELRGQIVVPPTP